MALAKLSVGDFGDEVALLQKQLTQSGLDISAQEAKRRLFGPATRNAVTEYQKKNGLAVTGEVDAATSAALSTAAPSSVRSPVPATISLAAPPPLTARPPVNGKAATPPVAPPAGIASLPPAAPAGSTLFVVRGQVRQPDGSPLSEAIVQAFDQDMRSQEKLGEGRTSAAGQYAIRYTAEQFSRDEKERADLVVRVLDAKGQQLAASTVQFNAAPETTINLTISGDYRPPSEIEQLVAEITPVAQTVAAADFTPNDIAFLTGETGMDRGHIELLSIASQHARKTVLVSTEVYYGLLRQELPTDLLGLLANNPQDLRRALETSLRDNIIPIKLESELDSILSALNHLLLQYALQPADKGGSPTLGDLLGTSTLSRNQQERFLSVNASRDGSADDFWNALRQDAAFKTPGAVDDLRLTLQLGALTQSNVPLVKAIQALRQRGTVKSLRDLVKLDTNAWSQLLNTRVNGQLIAIPDTVAGATPEEKRTNYINGMTSWLRATFPTAAAAQRVATPPAIDLGLVRTVLARNPGFNPGDVVPDSLDWTGVKNGDRARAEASLGALRQEINMFPGFDYKAWLAQPGAAAASSGAAPAVQNPVRDGVSRFLSNASDFDLHTTHVDSYIAANAAAFQGVRDEHKPAVIDQLKRTQRVFRVTPNYDHISGLMAEGLHSAYGIATMPRNTFIQTFQDQWGGREATTVYSRAQNATAGTTAFSAQVRGALNGASPRVLGDVRGRTGEMIKQRIPNWEKLFGSTSFCECGHCRSVYGPAAYFVDLLQFLGNGSNCANPKPTGTAPKQYPLKVLLRRRPDLEYIKLTCENAETPLPYVDLVNEILETYALLGMLDQSAAHDTGDTTADELSANPQYLNEGAYDKLKKAVYPLSLPFNRPLEVERTYLEHLGTSRHDVMKTFQNNSNPSDLAIACEYLRISPEEYEILTGTHLNGTAVQPPRKLPEFYGYNAATTTTTLIANLQPVPEFLRRTGVTYTDLIELVKTRFLNPAHAITLSVPPGADECDLSQTSINPLDAVTLQNIHRFIRLWGKLGWQVQELDKAIVALGAADIDNSLLLKLAQVKRLQSDFNLPLDQLLSFWAGIDTDGRDSLYIRLFQNNGVLKPVDHAFELSYVASLASLPGIAFPHAMKDQVSYDVAAKQLRFDGAMTDSQREDLMALSDAVDFRLAVDDLYQMRWPASTELATPGQFLSEHVNTILAALRISATGLASIRTATRLADVNAKLTPISLANLSVLYRHAVLAKALRLSVSDCLALIELTGIDPFQEGDPASTALFVDKARNARQSAFSVLKLNYLYRDIADPNGRIAPPQVSVDLLMIALQRGLRKIIDDANVLTDPTGDLLRQNLAIVLDAAMVDPVMKQLDGTDAYSPVLADTLAPFLDEPVATLTNLINDSSLLPANRFDHVLQRLMAHLNSRNFITQTLSSNLKLDLKLAEMLVAGGPAAVALLKSRADATQPMVDDFLALVTLLPYGPAPLPPDPTTNTAKEAYRLLHKVVLLINTFKMTTDEVLYLSAHGSDFSGADPADPNNNAKAVPFDFNSLPLASTGFKPALFSQWERLNALFTLRDSLPQGEVGLLDVFAASSSGDAKAKLVSATGWDSTELDALTDPKGFQLAAGDFKNEIQLVRLQACWALIKRLEVTARQFFDWATVDPTPSQAQTIQATAKAKYDDPTWLTIAKPLNDVLRDRQRAALVAYVLTDAAIQAAGITDSNGLYEYFLIDVEMGPCMMTSRIVQANASIQLFVQRCLMNLEEGKADPTQDVSPWAIDADHWQWMSQYRVWEANRKVFLYPENWILPELRDNKSPFFEELESELLQNDLTEDTAEEAIMNYLEKLDQVARLDICSMYWQQDEDPDPLTGENSEFLHVFGRTCNMPHVYFYRRLAMVTSVWTAWEKVPVDIQGDHLVPVVWNHHLYIFWPVFEEKSDDDQKPGATWAESTEHWQWRQVHDKWKKMDDEWNLVYTPYQALKANDAQKGTNAAGDFVDTINKSLPQIFDDLPAFAPDQEPKEPAEPQAAARPTLTHWEIKLAWSEYKHNKWTAKQTSSDCIRSWSLKQTLNDVLDSNGVKGNDRATYLPTDADPLVDPMALLYLPTIQEHFLKTRIDQGQVLLMVNRRYSTGYFSLFGGGLLSSFEGYDFLGQFVTACGAKVSVEGTPAQLPFKSLSAPNNATNSFMNLTGKENLSFTTNGKLKVALPSISGISYDVLPEHQVGEFALTYPFQLFFYQDKQKTYYVQVLPSLYGSLPLQFDTFFHPYVCTFIEALNRDGVPGLLTLKNQQMNASDAFSKYYTSGSTLVAKPYPAEDVDFSSPGAYALYNWELFFHIPLLIATRLSQNQRFEEAQRWFHYIFNPTDNSAEAAPKCFWKVLPFHDKAEDERIQDLLKLLDYQGTDPGILNQKTNFEEQVTEWRNKPFNPHLIARLRLVAYQKTVVMKYIDNLIAWGDYLFSQDTMQSVNQAIQLYVLASEILGPRPQEVPERGSVQVQTYHDLKSKLDCFSNALVELENEFPFTTTAPVAPLMLTVAAANQLVLI